jgi:hypothetical protein
MKTEFKGGNENEDIGNINEILVNDQWIRNKEKMRERMKEIK